MKTLIIGAGIASALGIFLRQLGHEVTGAEMVGVKFQNARGRAVGEFDLRDSRSKYAACSLTIRRSASNAGTRDACA